MIPYILYSDNIISWVEVNLTVDCYIYLNRKDLQLFIVTKINESLRHVSR